MCTRTVYTPWIKRVKTQHNNMHTVCTHCTVYVQMYMQIYHVGKYYIYLLLCLLPDWQSMENLSYQRERNHYLLIFYLLTKTFIFMFCLVHPWTVLVHFLYGLYEHARTGQVFSSCWDLNLGHLHISAKHDNKLHLNTELGSTYKEVFN